jgi:hypothetical protein
MKTVQSIIALIIAGVLTCIPAWLAYTFWAFAMTLVPVGEYAGLIKLGVSVVLFLAGFGITVAASLLFFALGITIAAFILDL